MLLLYFLYSIRASIEMIKKIIACYLYSSVHITICTTSLVLSSYWLCHQDVDLVFVFFTGLATLLIYSLHRIIGFKKHSENQSTHRFKWYEKNKKLVHNLFFISLLSCVVLFFTLNIIQQVIVIGTSIPSLAYVLPLFNTKRLRDIDYIKIFIVALTWAGVITFAPAINLSLNQIIWLFLEKTSFILAITLPFDFRDKELDLSNQVKTIANTFSKKIDFLIIISFIAVIVFVFLNPLYTSLIKRYICLIYLIIGIITIWANKQKHDFYISGIIDGTMILFTIGIYFLIYGTY